MAEAINLDTVNLLNVVKRIPRGLVQGLLDGGMSTPRLFQIASLLRIICMLFLQL